MDYTSHQEMRREASHGEPSEVRLIAELPLWRPKSRWIMVVLCAMLAFGTLAWAAPFVIDHGTRVLFMVSIQFALWSYATYAWYDYCSGWILPAINFVLAWTISDTFTVALMALSAEKR